MSDEIVSLFTLMDSHLSRTQLDEVSTENVENRSMLSGSSTLPNAPGTSFNIPKFFSGNSPIKDFLAEQISNTLKAKEKRKQEEEALQKKEEETRALKKRNKDVHRLAAGVKKLELKEDVYLIDLRSAIIPQTKKIDEEPPPALNIEKSKQSSKAETCKKKLNVRFDKETCMYKPWDPTLPCTTDISYIVINNKHKQKCSNLGKVICSRWWSVCKVLPYVMENVDTSNVKVFDFKTKSPGDLYKEYLENKRKPKMSTRFTVDIMDFI